MPSSEDALNRMIDAGAEENARVLHSLDQFWQMPEGESMFVNAERERLEEVPASWFAQPEPAPTGKAGSPERRSQDLDLARRSYEAADALLRRRLARR
jgi:hypothetical protein